MVQQRPPAADSEPELRDKLVRHFSVMKTDAAIIGRNNQDLIDDVYRPVLLRTRNITALWVGLTQRRACNRAAAIMAERLGPEYEPLPDIGALAAPRGRILW